LGITIAAVDWSPVSGLERHLGVFATISTDSGKHFPGSLTAIATTALLFPGSPALRATLGFVGVPLGSKEFLLASIKYETCATVLAIKGLVCIGHR
jgi:hypothetical protein